MRRTIAALLLGALLVTGGCAGSVSTNSSATLGKRIAASGSEQGAGSAPGASDSAVTAAEAACEQEGAATLLPGSYGSDNSSVPDNTPTICGCWTSWMQANMTTRQIQLLTSENGSPAGELQLSMRVVGPLTSALQQCDLGQTPSGGVTPTSTGTSPSPASPSSSTTPAVAGGCDAGPSYITDLKAVGVGCQNAARTAAAVASQAGCLPPDNVSGISKSCSTNGYSCRAATAANDPSTVKNVEVTCSAPGRSLRFSVGP